MDSSTAHKLYSSEALKIKEEFLSPNVFSVPSTEESQSDVCLNLFDDAQSSTVLSPINEMENKPTVEILVHPNWPIQNNRVAQIYVERIETLKELAREDGYTLDESSYNNFQEFLEKYPRLVRADLVLLDNGNLRAIWKGKNSAEIGLQFLKDSRVQYVLFNESGPNCAESRPYGRGGFEETMKKIKEFDLDKIMFE